MKKILTRDLMYLYTSIFCAGIQNMVTQMFFDTHYPKNKETLMAVTLFFGALFTVLGILASAWTVGSRPSKRFEAKRPRLILTAGMTLIILGTFSGLFFVKDAVLYTVLFSTASFCVNYIYNVFDVFLTADTDADKKEKNVRVLLGYQMLGYMIAPLFFSAFVSVPSVCIGFAVTAGICSYLPAGLSYIGKGISVQNKAVPQKAETESTKRSGNYAPMCYCFFMFTAVYMLLPSVAYLMKDYLNAENYALQSSIFLAGIVLVSSVVILIGNASRLWHFNILSPIALIIVLVLLLILKSGHAAILISAAAVSGIGYGVFLSGSRYFVNAADAHCGLVTKYNRTMTAASLFGYLFSAGIGFLCEQIGIAVVPVKFCIIILFLAAAACVSLMIKHNAADR